MTMWPPIRSVSVSAVVCVTLVAMQAQRQDAASGAQDATQVAAPGRGGQRGGGRADAPTVGREIW